MPSWLSSSGLYTAEMGSIWVRIQGSSSGNKFQYSSRKKEREAARNIRFTNKLFEWFARDVEFKLLNCYIAERKIKGYWQGPGFP